VARSNARPRPLEEVEKPSKRWLYPADCAVDHERVLAGGEELREPHVGRAAVRTSPLEDVVLGDDATGREFTPGTVLTLPET
jgi:hypothetical protein